MRTVRPQLQLASAPSAAHPRRRARHAVSAVALALVTVFLGPAHGQQIVTSSRASSMNADPLNPAPARAGSLKAGPLAACLILPSRTANIGSPLAGVVDSVEVERGDAVTRGDVLVKLRADVERAQASVSRTRADSEAELRGATAAQELALQRLDRSRALLGDRFLSQQAVDQAEAEYRLAVEKVSQARDALRVSAGESGVSQAQMAQRLIRAPFSGVITERYAQPGERYEEKPLLRIAAIDELRVEVVAPSQQFGLIRVGQAVSIEPDLPRQSPRTAHVIQIDQVLDPASNTFRIRLALDNRDHKLPAGLRCRADFDSPEAALPAQPAARTRPASAATAAPTTPAPLAPSASRVTPGPSR